MAAKPENNDGNETQTEHVPFAFKFFWTPPTNDVKYKSKLRLKKLVAESCAKVFFIKSLSSGIPFFDLKAAASPLHRLQRLTNCSSFAQLETFFPPSLHSHIQPINYELVASSSLAL